MVDVFTQSGSQAVIPNSVVKSRPRFRAAGGLLVATRRLLVYGNSPALWHLDAGGGSRPQDQIRTLALQQISDLPFLVGVRRRQSKTGPNR